MASSPVNILANEIAKKSGRLPLQFTGCISELSCRMEDYHAYSEALKNYSEAYRLSHAYVESGDVTVEHDYALNVVETEEHCVLGLLGDEIEQTVRAHLHFSDEEIEQYGYLGWLQH